MPTTLIEAGAHVSDPTGLGPNVVKTRWPNGAACPRLGCPYADAQPIRTRKAWRCKECKRQFTVRVGSIIERSPSRSPSGFPQFGFAQREERNLVA